MTHSAPQVQASNLLELESNLSELQRQYCKEVDKRIQAEEAKGKEEERLFTALVRASVCRCVRARAEGPSLYSRLIVVTVGGGW